MDHAVCLPRLRPRRRSRRIFSSLPRATIVGPDGWPIRARRRALRHGGAGPAGRPGVTPDPKQQRTVRVVLRGGVLSRRDAQVWSGGFRCARRSGRLRGSAGETVVLSGGRRLTGGRWGEANGRKAWVVDIPEVKEGTWRFRQLFVNGDRRPRTRLPKQGEYRIESLPGYTGDFLRSPTKQFVYAPGHIVPTWRNLRDVEVVGITRWLDNRLPIESVDGETRTVTFDRPSLFALVSSAPWGDSTTTPSVYWVENVFEALDTAGQWYLDRPQGRLYYLPRPGEDTAIGRDHCAAVDAGGAGRRAPGRAGA